MPSKNRPAPKPVVTEFVDGGAIVTKTHDVEIAREAILDHFTAQTNNEDWALEDAAHYLDAEPTLEIGRWLRRGDDEISYWTPGGGRGATRAVVWYL